MCVHPLMAKISTDSSIKEYNNITCAIFLHWGVETLMLFYWICCVCSWCMWRTGLPKWINTTTSSRWLWHFVPFPVIVLMLYWLLLSREQNLHAVLLIPFTHLHHSRTLQSVNPQSIFHSALEWLFHKLIGHTSHRLTLEVQRGTVGGGLRTGCDINTKGSILNAQVQQPVQSGSLSLWASPGAPAVLCSCICSSAVK